MSKAKKTPTLKTTQAFSRVLEQQTGAKRWGGIEHSACLGYLAESCIHPAEIVEKDKDGKEVRKPNPDAGKFNRREFVGIMVKDPELLYASNFKKLLVELGELEKTEIETGGYE